MLAILLFPSEYMCYACVEDLKVNVRKEEHMRTAGNRVWFGLASLLLGVLLVAFAEVSLQAASPEYPNRAISLIVPFPPGGSTDLGARAVADAVEKHVKQPVAVVNKVGGATTIAGYAVASAKPDGYTLGFFPNPAAIPEAYTFFQEAPYTSKDLKHISAALAPMISIAVKEDAPWNSFKELVEYAKKNPGLKVSTAGKQTIQHMFVTTMNKMEKTGFVPVPFTGDATTLPALLGGHVLVAATDYSSLKSLADAKRSRSWPASLIRGQTLRRRFLRWLSLAIPSFMPPPRGSSDPKPSRQRLWRNLTI